MYAVPKEKLDAIVDAINLKRDRVGGMEIDDMPLEIGLIEGSGISFPEGLSKIWMGSYSPEVDTVAPTIKIGLDEIPKILIMYQLGSWNNWDSVPEDGYNKVGFIILNPIQEAKQRYKTSATIIRTSAGYATAIDYSSYNGFVGINNNNEIYFSVSSTYYFRADKTYNIIALA